MTLTHRLTFARDGPKVMTVTDSNLPYKFEAGMRVRHCDGHLFIVTAVDVGDSGLWCVFGDANIYSNMRDCVADIDHPGTRGLLLAQYRETSGHEHAVALYACADESWYVDHEPGDPRARPCGHGESEGAAILDALTRLAASKAAAVEPVVDGDCHRRVDALAGHINVLDAKLARMDATLANIADRMANLDGMGAP